MFNNRIREVRERRKMSQSKLARTVGVAEPTLSQVERGQRAPWPKLRRELADVLEIAECDLFPEEVK